MTEPTIATRLVLPLIDTCEQLGSTREAAALRARLVELDTAVDDPEARMPLVQFYALLEHAAALVGDEELFGVEYSLNLDPKALDILGFLALTSSTLGVAFERMFRYQSLLYDGEHGSYTRAGDQVILTMQSWGPPRLAHRLWTQAAVIDIVVNGRKLVGHDFRVDAVDFRHRAPSTEAAARLEQLLGAPIRYEAPANSLRVPAAVLELPMPSADPAMFAFFDREAERRAAAHVGPTTTTADTLRPMLAAALPEGVPELGDLAERLHLSTRTLQRRLSDEGTSLRKLVDQVRHEGALRHLGAGLSIAEVSYVLGFSEPSAFHRAFKRWTGQTPKQWRASGHAS